MTTGAECQVFAAFSCWDDFSRVLSRRLLLQTFIFAAFLLVNMAYLFDFSTFFSVLSSK